jgi:hypothetical protein
MAKTPEEQALYVGIERASDAAMTFMASELGKARMRSGGETRFEQAEAVWFSYPHFHFKARRRDGAHRRRGARLHRGAEPQSLAPALLGIAGRYCGCCWTLPWESMTSSHSFPSFTALAVVTSAPKLMSRTWV